MFIRCFFAIIETEWVLAWRCAESEKNPAALECSTRLAPAHTDRHAASGSGSGVCVLQLCRLSVCLAISRDNQPAKAGGGMFRGRRMEGWPQDVAAASASTGGGRAAD